MHSFSYPATFRRDARGRILVGFPDLPEAHANGRDLREAVEEAIDCLGSAIAFSIRIMTRNRKKSRRRSKRWGNGS